MDYFDMYMAECFASTGMTPEELSASVDEAIRKYGHKTEAEYDAFMAECYRNMNMTREERAAFVEQAEANFHLSLEERYRGKDTPEMRAFVEATLERFGY